MTKVNSRAKGPDPRPLTIVPAHELGPRDLAGLMARAYAGYPIALRPTPSQVRALERVHGVDLEASVVARRAGSEVALALVARNGPQERLAAFGVVPEHRGGGVGRWLCERIVDGARGRAATSIELEVLTQNGPARALYRALGFEPVGRLLGFTRVVPERGTGALPASEEALEDDPGDAPVRIGLDEVAAALEAEGPAHLPWQSAPPTVARLAPPARGWRLGGACAAVTEAAEGTLVLHALTGACGEEELARLIRALEDCLAPRRWSVPALFPEEPYGARLESLGFRRDGWAQIHMHLCLQGRT